MPADKIEICAVCAWRADCQKKFSISGRDIKCPDFVRDVSIARGRKDDADGIKSKKESKKT